MIVIIITVAATVVLRAITITAPAVVRRPLMAPSLGTACGRASWTCGAWATRSLPYTLWQLLWRPGYLIRDYISGKRQVSFPPVKMLVVMALLVVLVYGLLGIRF